MSKTAKTSLHYTIRGIPVEVDRLLRLKATQPLPGLRDDPPLLVDFRGG